MFSCSYAGSVRIVLALGVFAGATLHARPARAQSAVDEKFREGADLYFRGNAEEALKIFQAILAENPSNQEALNLYNQAGKEVTALMLVKGGEFEATAKRFLELATLGRKEKTDDPAAIGGLVDQAMSGNYLDRRDALYALAADHGEYGAAPFIKFLGDEDSTERRVNAVYCLTHLSGDSVLPLLAALQSDNERVVWNASACLGAIRDARALAGLKSVLETATSETVKAAANDALMKVSGSASGSAGMSAADLHLQAATLYFRNDSKVAMPYGTQDAVWRMEGGTVVGEKVPAMLRNLRLAEQHCKAALENPQAQAILLAAYAGEKAAMADAKAMGAEGDAAELSAGLDVALVSGGPVGLSAALDFAVKNDSPNAAVELIRSLESMGAATESMTAALTSDYRSVRYHAAFALANTGDNSGPVVTALGDALKEDALRTALVVDDRSDSRNAMAGALAAAGYSVVTADSGGMGFARARSLPPKDVVIVRAGMSDVTLDQFVYDSDFRAAHSSLVVVADAAAIDGLKAQYEGKAQVKQFVSEPVVAAALVETVNAALPELNHERADALAAAERAATMLGHVPAAALMPARESLVWALNRSEESVLLGALKAVGHLGAEEAAGAVAALFADTSKSEVLRVGAADALGGIFARMSAAPSPEILKPVMDAVKGEANAAVRLAAGRALGSAAFLSAAERALLLAD